MDCACKTGLYFFTHLSEHTVLITQIAFRLFVDAVVSEMGEDITGSGRVAGVGLGGKPDQAIIVEVDTQRVDAGDQHIETQVKLGPVD